MGSVHTQQHSQLPAQHSRPTVVPDTPESQWGMDLAEIMLRNQGVVVPGAPASLQSVGTGAAARPAAAEAAGAQGQQAPGMHALCCLGTRCGSALTTAAWCASLARSACCDGRLVPGLCRGAADAGSDSGGV